jgi:IS30 family transposase
MEAIDVLSEILDQLADIETAMEDKDKKHNVNQMLETLYDFVYCEEDKAKRTAWLQTTGVLPWNEQSNPAA